MHDHQDRPRYDQYAKIGISITAGIVALLFLVSFVSLISFDPKDSDYVYPANTPVKNWAGVWGVLTARLCYQWFGGIAFLLPTAWLCVLLWLWAGIRSFWLAMAWLLWWIVLLGWCCTMASLAEQAPLLSDRMPSYGGIVGLFLLSLLRTYLGGIASWGILILLGFSLVFNAITLWLECLFLVNLGRMQQSGSSQ